MLNPTYPGVYVEEIPSGVRTIAGVSTSVTAFVGYARRGPMDKAVRILSWADYERAFGGLDALSEMSYAVSQFFQNGGSEAVVVRTARGAKPSTVPLKATGAGTALGVSASAPGKWGNALRVEVDPQPDAAGGVKIFNLTVSEVATVDGKEQVVATETFRNLSTKKGASNDAKAVVNASSKLVVLDYPSGASGVPAPTGTMGGTLPSDLTTLYRAPPPPPADPADPPTPPNPVKLEVYVRTLATPSAGATLPNPLPDWTRLEDVVLDKAPKDTAELASELQKKLRAARPSNDGAALGSGSSVKPAMPDALVSTLWTPKGEHLRVLGGSKDPAKVILVRLGGELATAMNVGGEEKANVPAYYVGGPALASQGAGEGGLDGSLPGATELKGSPAAKKGLYALEDADIFNILCIPETMSFNGLNLDDAEDSDRKEDALGGLVAAATSYCAAKRAFYILDAPLGATEEARDEPAEFEAWMKANDGFRHKNVAVYYPRPRVADPLRGNRLKTLAPSGTLAGLYARTDAERGVWKAPAGTEASLRNVRALQYNLTDPENGTLNPLGVNCLRVLPVYGPVAWGARTLEGADQQASEWKYVPVRRTALFIEESLYRGLKWVVFEPNDEPLWAQVRLNVGAFMHRLFRQGAFQGQTPKEAYFVKCDRTTTTQDDVNRGIVNILVGFAPLKPAEFVVIRLTQMAGQPEA